MTAPCPTFGFRVQMELDIDATPSSREQLRQAWAELLRGRGLVSRGGGSERRTHVVTSEASQAIESDRDAVRAWLESRTELRSWSVGALEDLGPEA